MEMESSLVNSILVSVSGDFALPECLSPTGSVSSNASSGTSSSGYSSSNEGEQNKSMSGRDILDLYSNLTSKESWPFKSTVLPDMDPRMFLTNRSVYHRCQGHNMEISGVENCKCCGFPIPVIL